MREVHSHAEWLAWLAEGANTPVAIQAVDCLAESQSILERSWDGSLFLNCLLRPDTAAHIVLSGGFVLPPGDGLAFDVHRAQLYTSAELYAGFHPADPASYALTPDARIYQQFLAHGKGHPDNLRVSLAHTLHDHSITDALRETLHGHRVVAIMGGHGLERASQRYRHVAEIARTLSRAGYVLITGGGPGAMEAAHLGAALAPYPDAALETAQCLLAPRPPGAAPGREYADADWLSRAWRVLEHFPPHPGTPHIGIPTWLYGHEPPCVFASLHAKYFANSLREDGLLLWAEHGVIFTPGSAGTLQELFQDLCQNHYQITGRCSPMILFGVEHWTHTVPAWPLLQTVSRQQPYRAMLHLTDDPADILPLLRQHDHPPRGFR